MVISFAEKALQIKQYNFNGLLNYLKKYYTNPDVNQRALERLRRIRQEDNEPFATFFPRFKRELIKNNKAAWLNYFKILYLKGTLNAKNNRLPYYYKSGPPKLPRFYKSNPTNKFIAPNI